MFRRMNLKARRPLTIMMAIVLLVSLSSCHTAGKPTGTLKVDDAYATAGTFKVTNGELWNELRWSAKDILDEKIVEVVLPKFASKYLYKLKF